MTIASTVDEPGVNLPLARRGSAAKTSCVEVFRDLTSLEPVWRSLERDGNSTVFQFWTVFQSWVRHIAGPQKVSWVVIAIRAASTGQPLMLLPLAVRREGGLQVVEFADLGVCDYNGPVVARQFRPAVMEMHRHWTEILDVLPAGDLLHLAKMPEFLRGQKNPLMSLAGVHRMKLASYGVALGPDWERWPAEAIEPKLLQEITARTRKLEKRGHVTFAVVQNPIEAQPVFEAMLEQRSQRHAQMQRPNILARPGYIDFYRSQFQNAHGDAPAAIASLAIDGELIATGYGLTGNGAFHMIFPTFKADRWRNYSPGLQLITRTMRWAAGRDYSFFDFTIGGESFKRDLGACERPLFEKYVALSPRGIPVIMASRVKRAVRQSPSMAQWAITALGLQNSGGL